MRFRDGLIAARGQILWIVLLLVSSVMILRADPPVDETASDIVVAGQ